MPTLTISIGRNVGATRYELPDEEWGLACNAVVNAVRYANGRIYFGGEGGGDSDEWGPETAYTVVCAVADARVEMLYSELEGVCQDFQQEAIAVTVGSTHMVEPF